MTDGGPFLAFIDDLQAIPDDAVIFRRVPSDFVDWNALDHGGRPRLTGQAFQDYPEEVARDRYGLPGACMSVGVESVLLEHGNTPSRLLDGYDSSYGLARLRAGDLRNLCRNDGTSASQGLMPNATDEEPWHAVVFSQVSSKKNKTIQRLIAAVASWEIVPIRPIQDT